MPSALCPDLNHISIYYGSISLLGIVTTKMPSVANRMTAQQMEAYKQALRDTGLFTEAEIEKYAKKADMTFEQIVEEEVKGRAAYESKQAEVWDDTIDEVEKTLLKKYPSTLEERQAARANNSDRDTELPFPKNATDAERFRYLRDKWIKPAVFDGTKRIKWEDYPGDTIRRTARYMRSSVPALRYSASRATTSSFVRVRAVKSRLINTSS